MTDKLPSQSEIAAEQTAADEAGDEEVEALIALAEAMDQVLQRDLAALRECIVEVNAIFENVTGQRD